MDPWDWSVDDVVANICHSAGSLWADRRANNALPNPVELERALRENEIDGSTLLTDVDVRTLKNDLGVKALGQRSTLLYAVSKLRGQSTTWKSQQAQTESQKRQISDLASVASTEPSLLQQSAQLHLQQPFSPAQAVSASQAPPPPVAHTVGPQPPHTPQETPPRVRPGEVLVESRDGGAKRRKVQLQSVEKPATAPSKPQQSTFAYLGRGKLLASEVIYGTAVKGETPHADIGSDDDSDFDFIGQRQRSVPGRCSFVNRRIRYLMDAEPRLIAPGKMKLVPYPKRLKQGQMPATLVKMIAPGTATVTKEDLIMLDHSDLGFDDPSLTDAVANNTEWNWLLSKCPVQRGEEALPVYGESVDGDVSDELIEQMRLDEEDDRKRSSKFLSREEVLDVINECVEDFKDDWRDRKLPAMESRSRSIWLNKGRSHQESVQSAANELKHLQGRLDTQTERILEQEWKKDRKVRKQCDVMDLTVKAMCELEWKMRLWQQTQAPPKQARVATVKHDRKQNDDADSIELSSDSDALNDFIEDDELSTIPKSQVIYGPKSMLQSETSNVVKANAVGDIDSVLDDDSPAREDTLMPDLPTPTVRSKDSVLDASSEDNNVSALPRLNTNDIDLIDLTEFPSSPPDFAQQAENSREPPRLGDLKTPEPADFKVEPSLQDSEKAKWFREPLSATQDDINSWSLEDLAERRDRKRLILKLLLCMELESFASLKSKFVQMDKDGAASAFRFEIVRALGEFTAQTGSLTGLSNTEYVGMVCIARLFICWYDPDPAHFGASKLNSWLLQGAREAVRTDVVEFRSFLRNALSEDGAAARDSDLEGDQDTPRKRRKKRMVMRSGHDLRESALQRRRAGQAAERTIQLKIQSSDLKEEDYSGHVINPNEDASNFICIEKSVSDKMLEHQVEGLRFLWREAIIGGHDGPSGCLLAHTMGLGKTMQTITFLLTIANTVSTPRLAKQVPRQIHPTDGAKFPRFLVLCPPGLIQNWEEELRKWIPRNHRLLDYILRIDSNVVVKDRFLRINIWHDSGGILILGYEMLRDLLSGRKAIRSEVKESLKISPEETLSQLITGADVVLADEAHKFKDPKSGIGLAMARLDAYCRIALTGSPLANNLGEYYAMINWVAPNYLGLPAEFKDTFQNPIEDGMYADSTRYEQRRSYKKLEALKEELEPKVNRKGINAVRGDLKPKTEFVLRFDLTQLQFDAYMSFVRALKSGQTEINNTRLFDWINMLTLLLYHPAVFMQKLLDRDAKRVEEAKKDSKKSEGKSPTEDGQQDVDVDASQLGLSNSLLDQQRQIFEQLPETYELDTNLSPKTQFIKQVVVAAEAAHEQVLIFSHSKPVLNHLQSWLKHLSFRIARLDGSTPMDHRQKLAQSFNAGDYDLMLISTRAGGLGLNLPGANRVILADFSFNPSWEEQAVGRAYRLGQQKPVFVYHLLYGGTFEEPLHHRTIFKKQLSDRAVDKMNTKPVANKMHEFFFEPTRIEETQDLEPSKGIDTGLDAVLYSGQDHSIRSITTTDIFHQNDEELNEEELQEVKKELQMWRMKGSDPLGYERLKKAQEAADLVKQQGYLANPERAAGGALGAIAVASGSANAASVSWTQAQAGTDPASTVGGAPTPEDTTTVDLTGSDDASSAAIAGGGSEKGKSGKESVGDESPPPKREP